MNKRSRQLMSAKKLLKKAEKNKENRIALNMKPSPWVEKIISKLHKTISDIEGTQIGV